MKKIYTVLLAFQTLLISGLLYAGAIPFADLLSEKDWEGIPFVMMDVEGKSISDLPPMPGFPLEKGFAVATCFSGAGDDNTPVNQDPQGFVLAVFDIQDPVGEGAPSGETNWGVGGADAFHGVNDSWTASNLGELFDIVIDVETAPNVYITSLGLTRREIGGIFMGLTPGSLGGAGTGGDIYKVDGTNGTISKLGTLPNTTYEINNFSSFGDSRFVGLGQIDYNFWGDVLYISNLDDGLIYVVNPTTGAQIATFDHGVTGRPFDGLPISADDSATPFTGIDRMVHGLGYSRVDNRLYYSVPRDLSITTNQVWSIDINEDGTLNEADITKEFELAPIYNTSTILPPPDQPTSSLITDISFGSDPNKLLIAEMSLYIYDQQTRIIDGNLGNPIITTKVPRREAHSSRVLSYTGMNGASWSPTNTFLLGEQDGPIEDPIDGYYIDGNNASGGVDWGFNNYGVNSAATNLDDAIVATGDALNFYGAPAGQPDVHRIYGLQISDANGNASPAGAFPENSYFVDLDGSYTTSGDAEDKSGIDDVEVFGFVPCTIELTAMAGACTGTTYSVTGDITFAEAPATETLTVSAGGQMQVFNVPFTDLQPYTNTLGGLTEDGVSQMVTAVFSDEMTCENTATITAPDCSMPPNDGTPLVCGITFTTSLTCGGTGANVTLNNTNNDGNFVSISVRQNFPPFSNVFTLNTANADPSYTISGLVEGEYQISVTLFTDNGNNVDPNCNGQFTNFQVNVPNAVIGANQYVCDDSGEGNSVVDFTGFVTADGAGGTWTDTDASGVNLANLAAVDFAGVAPGVYTFTYNCTQDESLEILVADCSVQSTTEFEGCDCKEYLYLNDDNTNLVHKFRIESDGNLTEIAGVNGIPWLTGINSPHGLAQDINGNIYIGAGPSGFNPIWQMDCDGNVLDNMIINNSGLNFASFENFLLKNNNEPEGGIGIYDLCTQEKLGSLCLNQISSVPGDSWGFSRGTDGTLYITDSNTPGGATPEPNHVWAIPNAALADFTGNMCFDPLITSADLPTTDLFGITADLDGNIYIMNTDFSGGALSTIYKYASDGTLITTLVDDNTTGFGQARGLTYAPSVDLIYVGANEDCISIIDPNTMTYVSDAGVGPQTGSSKGISLATECCPLTPTGVFNVSICDPNVGDVYFLNEVLECEGLCGGEWFIVENSAGDFDACASSLTLTSIGTSSTAKFQYFGDNIECGVMNFRVNFDFGITPTPSFVAGDQMVCPGDTPTPFTVVTAATGDNLTFQWQMSTTSATEGFTDIMGATMETYAPAAIMTTTYYRLNVMSATMNNLTTCDAFSNVITVTEQTVGCTADCSLSFSNIQSSNCTNGTFTGTFGVDYTGAPTTGIIEYSTNDDGNYISTGVVPTGTATGQAVVISGLDCNTRSIQMRFSDDTDCAIYIAYPFGPIDPAGYVYCIEDGTIVEGGTITVGLPPGGNFQFLNAANGDPLDGRNGRYAFVAVGTGGNAPVAGEYTITYTPPNGEPLVANSTPFGNGDDILDPTQTVDGGTGDNDQTDVNMNLLVGSDINGAGTMLQDFTLATNPYFTRFDLALGDPFIDLNNLPLQCLPDCDRMEILEEFVSCTDNGDGTYDFEVTFQVFWTYANATNETINIMVNGVMEEAFVPATNGGSEAFGPYTFTAPRFDLPISVAFSEKTSCADVKLLDLIACTPTCDEQTGDDFVGGNAFQDNNNNGTNDAEDGQANVLVRVYDCAEMLICEVYTDAMGNWSCDGAMMGDTFRVEYTTPLSPELLESYAGPDNGTSTQFVVGGMCDANYGVVNVQAFCEDANPQLVVPCYDAGNVAGSNAGAAGLIATDYSFGPKRTVASYGELGTVWGEAYQPTSGILYLGSFLKRNAGLSQGLGHIHMADMKGSGSYRGAFTVQGVNGIDLGDVIRSGGSDFELDEEGFAVDLDAFAKVGKAGFGDLDIYAGRILSAINLNSRTLINIDISDPVSLPTNGSSIPASLVTEIPLVYPDNCSSGIMRPFGLKYYEGSGYLGVVCDASLSQDADDLVAYVYRFNPLNPTALEKVLEFDLDYTREEKGIFPNSLGANYASEWSPWVDDWDGIRKELQVPTRWVINQTSPILSDIEFTKDGSMIIGMMDRESHRFGFREPVPVASPRVETPGVVIYFSGGDLLIACNNNGSYEIEGTGNCLVATDSGPIPIQKTDDGPGGVGEFFHGDFYDFDLDDRGHLENSLGSVALLPGRNEVIATAYDVNTFNQPGGLIRYNTTNGSRIGELEIVPQMTADDFRKSAGLGDIELICTPPPLQIGNYAWIDTDADGLQDPCEPPLAGLAVKLYRKKSNGDAPVLLATDTTDLTGNYYFSSAGAATTDDDQTWLGTDADTTIYRDSTYFIAFCGDNDFDTGTNSLSIDGVSLCPSPANMGQSAASDPTDGSDDQNDSDITVQDVAGAVLPAYCTTAGELAAGTNHTFDAGFKPLEFDLTLRKTLTPGQAAGFAAGNEVIFNIEVINQGGVKAFDVVVGDSIPMGMTYAAGSSTATGSVNSVNGAPIDFTNNYLMEETFVIDSLDVMDTFLFQVAVTIDAIGTSQPARPLINYAEIQAADNDQDDTNTPPTDIDSTPDDNFGNDAGGNVDSGSDDSIDGNGTGMPQDTSRLTDEDDADPAQVPIYDLALRKTIDPNDLSPTGSYPGGTDINFFIDVCNQGTDSVTNVWIKDYLPCGLDANGPNNDGLNPGWSAISPFGPQSVNDSVFFQIMTPIAPDSCQRVEITLRRRFGGATPGACPNPTPAGFLTNVTEIRQFEDLAGNMPPDFDSTPDGDENNDPGGLVNDATDNILDGNGSGAIGSNDPATDEDDHDPASLDAFDLAIFKVIDETTTPGPYTPNDVVKFDIGIVSQGNLATREVTITDLSPAGLVYDPALGMNMATGWTSDGTNETLTITDFSGLISGAPATQDTLNLGDTATVSIWLRVAVVPGGSMDLDYTNFAEIAEGAFFNPASGMEVSVTADGDSPYGLGVGNDTGNGPGSDDDNETLDNEPGEDIDSQDPAFVMVLLGVAVGDTTFIDVNNNGIQDAGDQALPNVTVTIIDNATGNPVTTDIFGDPYMMPTRTTDANGAYLFGDLPSGDYSVRFDISTAPNGDLYDYTTANVGNNDAIDSDVMPANPMDDIGTSDATGLIPPGDTILTLDAGVVCAISVEVADPSTICSTQLIDLTAGASITPASLDGFWTSNGDNGTFLNAGGAETNVFGEAVSYQPGAEDIANGSVTLTLTTNNPADLAPPSVCQPVSASVTFTILQVDCGNFPWDGN